MTEPNWLTIARSYIGFHEQANNRGIQEFIDLAHVGEEGDPWCAIFVNACIAKAGFATSGSALARSFEGSTNFIKIDKPIVGAIVTMWRGSKSAGTGHVTFSTGEQGGKIMGLGGNQADQVCIEPFPEDAHITGYWWPKKAEAPIGADIPSPMPADKVFSVIATEWGGPTDHQPVAYSDAPSNWEDIICFSVPYRFHGQRPWVELTYQGKTIRGPIEDVGPHHVNDPYFLTGGSGHPQAEGENGNHSGIDMSPAAAKECGFPGLGPVTWRLIDPPKAKPGQASTTAPASPAAPQIDWTPVVQDLVKAAIDAAPLVQPIAGPYLERWMGSLGRYLPELAIMAGAPTAIVHLVGILPPAQADIAYIVLAAMWGLGMQSRYAPAGPAAPAHQYHGGPKGN